MGLPLIESYSTSVASLQLLSSIKLVSRIGVYCYPMDAVGKHGGRGRRNGTGTQRHNGPFTHFTTILSVLYADKPSITQTT
jgi:hypothetical protein